VQFPARSNFGLRRQAQSDAAFAPVEKPQPAPYPHGWSEIRILRILKLGRSANLKFAICNLQLCSSRPAAILDCGGKRSATPLLLLSKSRSPPPTPTAGLKSKILKLGRSANLKFAICNLK